MVFQSNISDGYSPIIFTSTLVSLLPSNSLSLLGFKSMKTPFATIKGFEVMRIFRKGQMSVWKFGLGLAGEIRFIEREFGSITAAELGVSDKTV